VYASTPGLLHVEEGLPASSGSDALSDAMKQVVTVTRPSNGKPRDIPESALGDAETSVVAWASDWVVREGQIVLATVARLSTTQAFVEIAAIPNVGLLPFSHEDPPGRHSAKCGECWNSGSDGERECIVSSGRGRLSTGRYHSGACDGCGEQ
jgi:exosome complex RNA-binding protein Csl4